MMVCIYKLVCGPCLQKTELRVLGTAVRTAERSLAWRWTFVGQQMKSSKCQMPDTMPKVTLTSQAVS